MALKWKDKREVPMLSIIEDDPFHKTGRRNHVTQELIRKPTAVLEYKYMGRVNKSEQMMQYHSFTRKTNRLYKKLFCFFSFSSSL